MKFNEKLIELRKKEGLSQEELGYKLNVTRQTVSKWELGQTTPEMDKLIEMSKIFNISVDELINESEIAPNQKTIIEDQPIVEKNTKEKKIKIILIGVLAIVIILILVKLFASFSVFNIFSQGTDTQEKIIDKFFGIFDKAINATIENQEDNSDKYDEAFNKVINTITEENENNLDEFGNVFNQVTNIIDSANTEISGTEKQIYITKFNGSIEIFSGTQMGGSVTSVLDKIITSNKTEDRKITVKYMEIETQNEDEIKNIKRKIETFNNYEVSFEYDADGFINKAIIEKI